MLATLTPLLALLLHVVLAQHCQRGSDFVDTQSQCLLSANSNLENACYICPVLSGGTYAQHCLSLYDIGFATCTQPGSLQARQTHCQSIGGDINTAGFQCLVSAGTNKSQSSGWVSAAPTTATGAPSGSTATVPTAAPTGGVHVTASALMFTALLLTYALTH